MEPAFFGGSGEKMGHKIAGKKFPTDWTLGLPKAGGGIQGPESLLQIIYVGDIFKCWLYIILRAFNSFLPERNVELKSTLVAQWSRTRVPV